MLTYIKIKKNKNIFDSFTEEGTAARMINRFGNDLTRLYEMRPCAFDDYGELVELEGTGLENEYDAEIFIDKNNQMVFL